MTRWSGATEAGCTAFVGAGVGGLTAAKVTKVLALTEPMATRSMTLRPHNASGTVTSTLARAVKFRATAAKAAVSSPAFCAVSIRPPAAEAISCAADASPLPYRKATTSAGMRSAASCLVTEVRFALLEVSTPSDSTTSLRWADEPRRAVSRVAAAARTASYSAVSPVACTCANAARTRVRFVVGETKRRGRSEKVIRPAFTSFGRLAR